jgi:hypothetical protein
MTALTMRGFLALLERVLNRLPEDAAYGCSASLGTGELHLSVDREHVETALSVLGMDPTPNQVWPMAGVPQREHVRWTGQVDGITVILGAWRPVDNPQDHAVTSGRDSAVDAGTGVAS